jgi:predicted DNA-binding WGR domain protein
MAPTNRDADVLYVGRMWSKQVSNERQPKDIPIEALAQFTGYIRFYLLSWQPDLDGSRVLVCTWGRIGTRGRSRVVFYPKQANAQDAITRIIKRRLQRGYQVTEWR